MKIKTLLIVCALFVSVFSSAAVSIKEVGGWFESGYVTWNLVDGASSYHVYCKAVGGEYKQLDAQLVRNYGAYGRADVLGITAGTYQFKVIPVAEDETEMAAQTTESATFVAKAHDRGGFAHLNYSQGVGGYTNDGTLKANATVLYVTAKNAKTISCTFGGTTFTGIQAILDAANGKYTRGPLVIRLVGTLSASDIDGFSSSSEGLQIKGVKAHTPMDITFEGVGNDATIHGFGFLVRACASVEIRNIAVMKCMDDGISFDTDNSHCWAHNVDFFYGNNNGGDKAKGDGSLDVKMDSQYMTFSYNHFWDSGKSSLCGMKTESGENFITYHHNWFDHSDSRHPRVRTMTVHVYNNYYDGVAKYGVGATTGSNVFVENNYFRNTNKPMMISLQGTDIVNGVKEGTFSGESGGMIKSFGNVFAEKSSNFKYVTHKESATSFDAYEANTRTEKVPDTYKTLSGGAIYNNFDTDASKMYEYVVDDANGIPAIITGQYGAGRMQHGDFKWTFNNATDDENYEVDNALRSAIVDYKTTFVGFFTEVGDGGEGGGDNPGGGTDVPSDGDYACNFQAQTPSNTFYKVSGEYSNSKGSVTVGGTTYTYGLKTNSTASVEFKIEEPMTLTLVFKPGASAGININDTKVNDSSNIITYDLEAGSYKLAKGSSSENCLFYINLVPKNTTSIISDRTDKTIVLTKYYNLSGVQIRVLNDDGIYIQENIYDDGSVERKKIGFGK